MTPTSSLREEPSSPPQPAADQGSGYVFSSVKCLVAALGSLAQEAEDYVFLHHQKDLLTKAKKNSNN